MPPEQPERTLKGLRISRTCRRKNARSEIDAIEGLYSPEPKFPNDMPADAMLIIMTQHVERVRELDAQIRDLLGEADDADLETELTEVEQFETDLGRAVAAIKAAVHRKAEERAERSHSGAQVGVETIYETPEGVRHVRFKPTMSSTISQPVGLNDNETSRSVSDDEEVQPTLASGAKSESRRKSVPGYKDAPTITTARLPRELDISPEVFDGDRLKYRSFITQFTCFVNKRTDAAPIERLMILRKYVSGEPKQIVHALELTDANYQVALDLLKENYARVENETEKILSGLRNLPRVTRYNDLQGLRKLVTLIQGNIATLAANGIPLTSFALSLKSAVEAALPPRMRQEFKDDRRLEERLGSLSNSQREGAAEPAQTADSSVNNNSTAADSNSTVADKTASEVRNLIEFMRKRVRDWEDNKYLDESPKAQDASEGDRKPPTKPTRYRPKSTIASAVEPKGRSNANSKFKPRACLFCRAPDHRSSRCTADIPMGKRREMLRTQRRCAKCFMSEHTNPADCGGARVPCSKCSSRSHYTSMHDDSVASTGMPIIQTASAAATQSGALLLTASAYVINGGMRIPIRVFLDTGSTLTVISPSLRSMLREPPVAVSDLHIQTFSNLVSRNGVPLYNVRLISAKGGPTIELLAHEYPFEVDPPAVDSESIKKAIQDFDAKRTLADRTHVGEWNNTAPVLLVGMNQLHVIMNRELPEPVVGDLVAHSTKLGWVVGGAFPMGQQHVEGNVKVAHSICCAASMAVYQATLSSPAKALEALWNLEKLGIVESPSTTDWSADEEAAVRQFNESVTFDGNRYVVGFPKRQSIELLSNNLDGAKARLERRISQLRRDPARYEKYHRELMRFIQDGFAVEVSNFDPTKRSVVDGSYYMPHHEVVTSSSSSEKWRIVFDCSAREKGETSLNDHLLPGPNLNPCLVSLLLRFRMRPIALSADISKAYMRIAVTSSDQRLFRFLWRPPDTDTVRAYQMQRVTWGAASSGFLLAATVRHHLKISESTTPDLAECLYADDFLQSFDTVERAKEFADAIRLQLAEAGMSLAKWKTNSEAVRAHLMETGLGTNDFDSAAAEFLKVLGISWSPSEDVLWFKTPLLFDGPQLEGALTKRRVLSIVASIFDPLGWLTPYTLRGKKIIQQLWSTDLQWNQEVSAATRSDLMAWRSEMEEFRKFSFARRYSNREGTPVAHLLHVFGDASQTAFASAAYIETRFADGSSTFSLVMGKSRLAPRDPTSLPRLELLASLMAVRLKRFIVDRLNVDFERILFYTDSTIAFHWATGAHPGSWKQFVSNRVREIQAESNTEDWFHIPGEHNISDLATRGVSASTLIKNSDWWTAPAWLRLPMASRPISQPQRGSVTLDPVQREMRAVMTPIVLHEPQINLDRYSTAGRAIRVVANVIRFGCLSRKLQIPALAELHRRAETAIIRWCQQKFFPDELRSVAAGENVCGTSKLAAFQLFLDERGLLRAKTRLTEGPFFTYDEKNPVIIPGESRFARLLILEAHRTNAHFGVNTVLTQIRKRFWITRGRQIIRGILRKCVVCRRRQGSHGSQVEAPLPESRVTLGAPFEVTGIDFCGPFWTRQRTETLKTYVALFTCSVTRAIHLEALPSMSTPQTHLAIRRFLSVRRGCRRFISDNAKNFVKAATDIKRLFNSLKDPEVKNALEGRSIEWSFLCPRASWHAGFYERLVGTMKAALYKTLGRSLIGFEEFRTILSELAAVINDRPLTHTPADANEPSALTPAHFLDGGPYRPALASLLPLDQLRGDEMVPADELRKNFVQRTSYFKNLSVRWYREYLALLRSATMTRGRPTPPIRVGDVCLLRDDNLPRIRWRLVRILEAHTGRDGHVRVYTVKFDNQKSSRRAAQLLYPLELSLVDADPNVTQD